MADTQEQLLANFDKALLRFSTFRDNHRVVVLPDAFSAYPLRKDYPLRGRGERHNFQRITRAES